MCFSLLPLPVKYTHSCDHSISSMSGGLVTRVLSLLILTLVIFSSSLAKKCKKKKCRNDEPLVLNVSQLEPGHRARCPGNWWWWWWCSECFTTGARPQSPISIDNVTPRWLFLRGRGQPGANLPQIPGQVIHNVQVYYSSVDNCFVEYLSAVLH